MLDNGQLFPALTGPTVEGSTLRVPDGLDEGWSVLLFYRGFW